MPDRPPRYRPPRPADAPDRTARPSAHARGYTRAWQRYARSFLADHPLCVTCERDGLVVAAEVVDHVTPHKGDDRLFWDAGNHQALCKRCHDAKTVREDGGFGRPQARPEAPPPAPPTPPGRADGAGRADEG